MKAFFLLVVFTAAGLAGVFYWRRYIQASHAPVAAASAPAKPGKERHRRHRRGARRLARNEVFVASAPSDEAPPAEGTSPGLAPPPPEQTRPLAPGGAETTEVAGTDLFDPISSPSPSPSGGQRPAVVEPPAIKLRPGDLKMVWQGEDLSRAENMRLDFSKDEGGRELSQDEIDARFHTKEDAVLACIARARPDDYTLIPGRVTVRFRIHTSGAVKGVQVEAPAILQRGGLTGCIRGVMNSLRFPASNASQVISYPFTLM